MSKLSIKQVFEAVAQATTIDAKVLVLRQNSEPGIHNCLRAAFDPAYEWDLPEGLPPIQLDRSIPDGYAHNNLKAQSRLFYIFDKRYTKVNKTRKEMLFINLLEGLHHSDVDLIIAIKDGQLPIRYAGLNEDLVRIAYPGLLSEPKRVEEVPDPR